MGRLDPQLTNRLKDLRRRTRPEIEEFAGNRVAVLVKYTGDVERLREAGLEVVAEAARSGGGGFAARRAALITAWIAAWAYSTPRVKLAGGDSPARAVSV